MVTQEGEAHSSAQGNELADDRGPVQVDRFKRLPPAVSIATAVATVGAVPTVPFGPEGAVEGGDGD